MQQIESSKKKDFKKNMLLLFITLVFFFFIFEIFLRLFAFPIYGFQRGVFVYDETTGYGLSSNYAGVQSIFGRNFILNTNSKGLRDTRDYEYRKENDVFRILILGDSFSFGNGVDLKETYPEYLRENFNDKKVEIINLGVPGYGINHQYLYFIEEGVKYSPDLVLIQFSPNDWGVHSIIKDGGREYIDKNYSLIADSQGFLVESSGESSSRSVHLFLLKKVRTYSFFYTKSRLILSNIVKNYWKKQLGVPLYFYETDSNEYLEAYEGYLLLIKKIKNSTKADIIIFAGPFVDTDIFSQEDIKREYNLNYDFDPKQVKKSLEDIARGLNLSFIRLDWNNPDIFLPVDGHWNSKGNKIVADELYKHISVPINK